MSTLTKAQQLERREACDALRVWLKPGDTVYTILDHVSRSGMSRRIRCVLPTVDTSIVYSPKLDILHPTRLIARACGLPMKGDAIVMGGCGMDMGFALVYELSHALFGAGYSCLGAGRHCPSNYHSNVRGREVERFDLTHTDGYALRQSWL